MEWVSHPSCSPDLALSDLNLSVPLKKPSKGISGTITRWKLRCSGG